MFVFFFFKSLTKLLQRVDEIKNVAEIFAQ